MTDGSNRLTVLAADLRRAGRELKRAEDGMADRVMALGAMLQEARAEIPHGQFESWVQDNAGISPRHARRYMLLAKVRFKSATVAEMGIGAAAEFAATLKAPGPGQAAFLDNAADAHAVCWPSVDHPGFMHTMVLGNFPAPGSSGGELITSTKPIRAEWVWFAIEASGFSMVDATYRLEDVDMVKWLADLQSDLADA